MHTAEAEAQALIRRHLRRNEELVWLGKPETGWRFTPSDWYLIPFGILWAGFVVIWEAVAVGGALATGDPAVWLFPLFGIPFLIVGWFLTIGRFRLRSAQRRRLTYALTNRRVLGIERGSVESVRSVFLEGLSGIGQRIGADGVGTLSFEPIPPIWAMYAGSGLEWMIGGLSALPLQFFDVKDAANLVALIEQQRERLNGASSG